MSLLMMAREAKEYSRASPLSSLGDVSKERNHRMTDVSVAEVASPDTAPAASSIIKVRIIKVKDATVDVDLDALPIEVYKEMLRLGAETYINKVGMSKIGAGLTKLEGTELTKAQNAVVAQAQKNVTDMLAGKIKIAGEKSATKVSGAVNTEAMRLAKNIVKDWMKQTGRKISHTPASEITAGAKEVLSAMPELYVTAEENLKKRAETPIKGIDLSSIVKEDPKLVAKANEAKAAKKKGAPLSAKQAGLVAPKSKPKAGQQPTAH